VHIAVLYRSRLQRRRLRRIATAVNRTTTGAAAVTGIADTTNHDATSNTAIIDATSNAALIDATSNAAISDATFATYFTTYFTTTSTTGAHQRLAAGPRATQAPVAGHRAGVPGVHKRVFCSGTGA